LSYQRAAEVAFYLEQIDPRVSEHIRQIRCARQHRLRRACHRRFAGRACSRGSRHVRRLAAYSSRAAGTSEAVAGGRALRAVGNRGTGWRHRDTHARTRLGGERHRLSLLRR
jgi:hypothetical protein